MDRWQAELVDSYTDPWDLLGFLEIDPLEEVSLAAAGDFPFRVTRSYARRMSKGDARDPLLLQVLPAAAELVAVPGFVRDPVGDLDAAAVPGVLHKYRGRALLLSTAGCAIHCRYCFRRGFPYRDLQLTRTAEGKALEYIAVDPSIREVILSGGDPLLLSDGRIAGLMESLAAIPHVLRVRIHSRIPVVLPSRLSADLAAGLVATRLQTVVVIHANHPNEWDAEVASALERLRAAGVALLNQSVLLRGINDDAATLAELGERFFRSGVLPYYLHLLDRALGTAHFEVSEQRARALHRELRRRLPGYLVPRLVREQAGWPYKVPL